MTMTTTLSDEQQQLTSSVRRFLGDKAPLERTRARIDADDPHDPELWEQLGAGLDLIGLAVPEEVGGAGFSFVEQCLVLEEMGAVLLHAPYLASAVAATSLLLEVAGAAARADLLPRIASGELVATVAQLEPGGGWDLGDVTMTAHQDTDRLTLRGEKAFVLDGQAADVVLVVARSPDGRLDVVAVDPTGPGVEVVPVTALDPTRPLAHIRFHDAAGRRINDDDDATKGLAVAVAHAIVGLAAEQVGGARRCLDMSVDYAKVRNQFGRPIGSFQAVKHQCADMFVLIEAAQAAARYAAQALAEGAEDRLEAAAVAKAYCSDAYIEVAGRNVHIHGGVGFTAEHDAHLFFKRARSSHELYGSPTWHRELLARSFDR